MATAIQRQAFEKEILEISEREQLRIGRDLHDGLCQQLAGIALSCNFLQQGLAAASQPESVEAANIAQKLRETIEQTTLLARGLSPVALEANGLMSALAELALSVTKLFRTSCEFKCEWPVSVRNHK